MLVNPGHQGKGLFFADSGAEVVFYDRQNDENVMVRLHQGAVEFFCNTNESLRPPNATHKVIGSGIAQRDVYHFITKEHCTHLRAGLTVHRSLASSTPHTFELAPEPGFEELFWFRIADGDKAIIEGEGLWPDGSPVDAAWPVRDGDVVQVPMGSHRVMALPDVDGKFPQVAYVWCYLCTEERWEK